MGRWRPLVALALLASTACGATVATDAGNEPTTEGGIISALFDPQADGLPEPLVDTSKIISGGPPPDGIPPIDSPVYAPTAEIDFVADDEPVVALEIDGDARAYPVQIMTWHEIVNDDDVGGVPVTVSFCPLCNSAIAYDRRVDGDVLDFGTSGMLFQSALVMYDRQTESLWSHFSGQAIAGTLTGTRLTEIPMATVSWADWRDANPDGLVLTRETGHSRDYGRNPYAGYDSIDGNPFLFLDEPDGRLAPMTRVVGIRTPDAGPDQPPSADSIAVLSDRVLEDGVVNVTLAGQPLVILALPGTASALDTPRIADGRDVGATGVFDPRLGGRRLQLSRDGDRFVDATTGAAFDIFGRGLDGPTEGRQLRAHPHVDTFWFAWAAFLPDTRLIR